MEPSVSTTSQRRAWTGHAVLSHGFRPFFFLAGAWAAVAMSLWIGMLAGRIDLPTAFDPLSWHAHEFVFGYAQAVIAGFLMTAVPNWTGRLPLTGWPLAGLVLLWLGGRAAVGLSALLPLPLVALAALAEPLALAALIGREILAGRNWRNLPVPGILAVQLLAQGLFLAEAFRGDAAFSGPGLRLGLAATILMIALIGGRILPSFTRNWLAQGGNPHLPVPPGRADLGVLAVSGLALAGFVLAPDAQATAGLCGMAGLAQLWRLSRWQGLRTGAEPLLAILHLAYLALALGFLTVAAGAMGWMDQGAALHLWLAGAVGLMTLAVMTRASLGHTGRALHAGPGLTAIYGLIVLAVLARMGFGIFAGPQWLLDVAGGAWILGFGGFALTYAPILLGPAAGRKLPSARPA